MNDCHRPHAGSAIPDSMRCWVVVSSIFWKIINETDATQAETVRFLRL
jgi:hypothetical protein